ncbi:hypothetical protein J6590_062578 [Homalodisca vitripennis]|nr:hypothetical protein J6590_062578 [Homalodisca vitripennis]
MNYTTTNYHQELCKTNQLLYFQSPYHFRVDVDGDYEERSVSALAGVPRVDEPLTWLFDVPCRFRYCREQSQF